MPILLKAEGKRKMPMGISDKLYLAAQSVLVILSSAVNKRPTVVSRAD